MTERKWYRRLNVQLVAFLTLALLPLGSVAIVQTNRVAADAERNLSAAFLGLTERAARAEQVLIERAVGAARLFGNIAPELLDDPESCTPILSRFIETNVDFSFIGVIPTDGLVTCSSLGEPIDFSQAADFSTEMAAQQPAISALSAGLQSGEPAFVVSEPFEANGVFAGFVSISIPVAQLPNTDESLAELGLIELVTFNEGGELLSSRAGSEVAAAELPQDVSMSVLSTERAIKFRALNQNGIERRYSIVTIEGSPAAVMAIWDISGGQSSHTSSWVAPIVFPILMWFASMGVAMLANHTLVLRHLRRLRHSMDRFADNREARFTPDAALLTPLEIEELSANFQRMSEEIVQDEARLEGSLREKGVLVKEIHHRVKNNLQLISSIMNMQIRTAQHSETKHVLKRLQDRVLSLATIHRDLYQSQDGGAVDTSGLITEIVERSIQMGASDSSKITLDTQITPVRLYPDQAVPLSLLVAETATNAMKHIGPSGNQSATIRVHLTQEGTNCRLLFSNTIGVTPDDPNATGLGSKLMRAFALQLGGQLDTSESEDTYTLTLDFEVREFQPDARDY